MNQTHSKKEAQSFCGLKPDTGVILGADAIGELRKISEAVGKEAAQKLITELSVQPTVDVYLADMLDSIYGACTWQINFFSENNL